MNRQPRRRPPFDSAQRVAKCLMGVERLEVRAMPAGLPLAPPPPTTTGPTVEVRSFDGSGNNLAQPEWGSTGEQLLRRSVAAYGDGVSDPSGSDRPSARVVSNLLAANPAGGLVHDRHVFLRELPSGRTHRSTAVGAEDSDRHRRRPNHASFDDAGSRPARHCPFSLGRHSWRSLWRHQQCSYP